MLMCRTHLGCPRGLAFLFVFYFVAFSSHVLCLLSLMVALGHGSADLASSSAVKMMEGPPTLSFVLLSAAAKVTS